MYNFKKNLEEARSFAVEFAETQRGYQDNVALLIQHAVQLHLAAQENELAFGRVLKQYGIRNMQRQTGALACIKLMFTDENGAAIMHPANFSRWAQVADHVAAMVQGNKLTVDEVPDYVKQQGGASGIYLQSTRAAQDNLPDRHTVEAVLNRKPSLGFMSLRKADLEADMALSVVRKDERGRYEVIVLDQNPQEIAEIVGHYAAGSDRAIGISRR